MPSNTIKGQELVLYTPPPVYTPRSVASSLADSVQQQPGYIPANVSPAHKTLALSRPKPRSLTDVGLSAARWPTLFDVLSAAPAQAAVPGLISNARRETEHFGDSTYTVWNVSPFVKEAPAISLPNLWVVRLDKFVEKGTVWMDFGRPNLSMGVGAMKVDAKSFRRAPTKIVDTHGKVQSGVFLIPINLSQDAMQRVTAAAFEREGTYNGTCVHANTIILKEAGFTIGGKNPEAYLPHTLLACILREGLEFDGAPVQFAIVRTTPLKLHEYVDAIENAVTNTFCRHYDNAYDTSEARQERIELDEAIRDAPEPSGMAPILRRGPQFDFSISQASNLGAWARLIWGPHPIYKLDFSSRGINVNDYLPTTLRAFPHANPSLMTRVKKNLLFAQPVVNFVRGAMVQTFRKQEPLIQSDLTSLMRPNTATDPNVFNVVVTSKEFFAVKNSVWSVKVDWVLSKHVLISGYSDDVRFAGEMWLDEELRIHFNPNSGTYMPSEEALDAMLKLARQLFPNVPIQADRVVVH